MVAQPSPTFQPLPDRQPRVTGMTAAMAPSGKRLHDLLEQALTERAPESGLRAVATLRGELAALERRQARRALDDGASFGSIARALGISRQAAHRRYRGLPGEPPEEEAPESAGGVPVTSQARFVVALARDEARGLGSVTMGTEHLLLGIVREGNGRAAEALAGAGVTLDAARQCAQPTMVGAEPAAPGAEADMEGPRAISPFTRKVFEQSLREALARGDGYIGTDHLLLAALRETHGGAARTLEALGVAPAAVAAELTG